MIFHNVKKQCWPEQTNGILNTNRSFEEKKGTHFKQKCGLQLSLLQDQKFTDLFCGLLIEESQTRTLWTKASVGLLAFHTLKYSCDDLKNHRQNVGHRRPSDRRRRGGPLRPQRRAARGTTSSPAA